MKRIVCIENKPQTLLILLEPGGSKAQLLRQTILYVNLKVYLLLPNATVLSRIYVQKLVIKLIKSLIRVIDLLKF